MVRKVLHVDDDPDIVAVVRIAAEFSGLTVRSCHSGSEVESAMREFNPDVVILDVMMPEMDGPTILRSIRQIAQFAETPVIFLTAKVNSEEKRRLRSLGAIGVLEKPFDPISLGDSIRAMVASAATSTDTRSS